MIRPTSIVPTRLRPWTGLIVGSALTAAAIASLVPFKHSLGTATPALILLVPVVAAGYLGGLVVAVVVALEATVVLDAGFVPPFASARVQLGEDLVALIVFAIVAVAVGSLVGGVVAAEQRRAETEAARIRALESVDRQRSALLRSVSHDLRTPLATIRAVATDLRADTDYDPATRGELVGLVVDEAERLDRLVANLLSMSRIEAGSLLPDRQPLDVGELIEACARRLHRLTSNVHLAIEVVPDLPLVPADYSQLDQVLTNLVENATKHSQPGASVTVAARASTDPVTAGGVCITVTDEGPGLDPAQADRIFEPFVTGGPATSTGIGLAICKAIVDAHHGTIGVTSSVGAGATFFVNMPAMTGPGMTSPGVVAR